MIVGITWDSVLDWAPIVISTAALFVALGGATLPYWRRPNLSLHLDSDRTHSRVEGNNVPYLRLRVRNAKGKRSAQHARVVLDGYKREGDQMYTRLGSPFLGWPSTFGQESSSYVAVIFPNADRPVGLGRLVRVKVHEGRLIRKEVWTTGVGALDVGPQPPQSFAHDDTDATWWLHLELADEWWITDDRDWLAPGTWRIRLIIGAHDGNARAYEVKLSWRGDEKDANAVLSSVLDSLTIRFD